MTEGRREGRMGRPAADADQQAAFEAVQEQGKVCFAHIEAMADANRRIAQQAEAGDPVWSRAAAIRYNQVCRDRAAEGSGPDPQFLAAIRGSGDLKQDCDTRWLLGEAVDVLRERLDRLEMHEAELEQFLAAQAPGTFSRANLSAVFEWMTEAHAERVLRAVVRACRPGARLAYWNNLVPRSRPASMADVLRPQRALAREIHHRDRAFLYRDFHVEEVVAHGD